MNVCPTNAFGRCSRNSHAVLRSALSTSWVTANVVVRSIPTKRKSLKLHPFAGIDLTAVFTVTQLVDKADRKTAWEFLDLLLEAFVGQTPHRGLS